MFTPEELSALYTFLERVNVNGKEADSLVYLKNKIAKEAQPKEEVKEPKKK